MAIYTCAQGGNMKNQETLNSIVAELQKQMAKNKQMPEPSAPLRRSTVKKLNKSVSNVLKSSGWVSL